MRELPGEDRRLALARLIDLQAAGVSKSEPRLVLVEAAPGEGADGVLDAFAAEVGEQVALLDRRARRSPSYDLWRAFGASLRSQLATRGTSLPSEETRGRAGKQRALLRLLETAAEHQPLVLLVRDLHRADVESRAVLAAALTLPVPLLAVATVPPGWREERLRARVERLTLGAIDEDAVRALLSRPDVLRRLVTATGGSLAALERWLASAPPSFDAVCRERWESLDGGARDALATMAYLERATAGEVDGPLRRLVLEGWVRERGGRFEMTDADVACWVRRRRPEVASAAAAQAWATGRVVLAMRTWIAAEDGRALESHLGAACELLADEDAHAEAVALIDEALPLLGPEARRAARLRAVSLLDVVGEPQRALAIARAAHEDGPEDAEVATEVGRLLLRTGDPEGAAKVLRGPAEADGASLRLRALWAEVAYQAGRRKLATRVAKEVLRGDDPRAELDALQTLAKLGLARGAAAAGGYERYAARAEELGDLEHRALALGGRGVAAIRARDLDAATLALLEAREAAERAGSTKARALAAHNLAVVAHLKHDYREARATYEEALEHLRTLGHRTSLARCAFNLGELYEALGAHDLARSMANLGAQLGGATLSPAPRGEGLLLRGRIALSEGATEEAEAALEAASAIFAELDPVRDAAARVGLARVAIARRLPERALGVLDGIGVPLTPHREAEALLARADAERALSGRLGRELRLAEAAMEAASRAQDPLLEMAASVTLARALRERGDVAAGVPFVERARELDAAALERVPVDLRAAFQRRPARRRLEESGARRRRVRMPGIVVESEVLQDVLEMVGRVAPTGCTVLLRGESGTGKELVAESIHRASSRRAGPLVRVNCAALVETLLMSELFGHEKGAFTGATSQRRGRFELADGGTLFLDEIGDVSKAVQASLLRVLQERELERVGGHETISVDVRIVAATHRDLEAMVEAGTFREDLYYRLNEVTLRLPPLRERPEDVAPLAEHVLERIAEERAEPRKVLSDEALTRLRRFSWPGNVRQLENVIQAASLFAEGSVIREADLSLPEESHEAESDVLEDAYARMRAGELSMKDLKREIERQCIARALGESDGNITQAAGMLGMKRPRLSQLVKEYGLRDETKAHSAREGEG